MSDEDRRVGVGVTVGTAAPVRGVARFVAGIDTVLELMSQGVEGDILIVEDAAATGVAPIIGDALGVICTSGGPTSHLSLVAKEFGVACVMGAALDEEPADLDGATIEIGPDGSISIVTAR